jgi:hypothetical protein
MADVTERKLLNLNTTVTVGGAVSIITALWYVATLIAGLKNDNQRAADRTESELRIIRMEMKQIAGDLQTRLDSAGIDRWTAADMRRWAREFREKNPTLTVPDPEHR